MSRLDYAPKLKDIQVTDFQKGLGVFTPLPNKPVSFAALKETLKKAGYTLSSAEITVKGSLEKNNNDWALAVKESGQRFILQGPSVSQLVSALNPADSVEVSGEWKTVLTGKNSQEVIVPAFKSRASTRSRFPPTVFAKVAFTETNVAAPNPESTTGPEAAPLAPIRTTSPGLTVYKGGAVTPRFFFIRQHLGSLEVDRQVFDLSVSYTPSPRLQLEVEVPVSRTEFDNGNTSGSSSGFGNITTWAKYRFFRKVKTYGDRQAAARVGLELPTGKATAPSQANLNAPEFVRQQLTPINGGFSPHLDLAFSQAGGRLIFGGNAEIIFRTERDGFRMGHEQRVSTDLEYVIPKDPHKPGGELFLILETTFVHRGTGRLNGSAVDGSRSTEYYLAPGLQYAAHPRFVIEGSFQFPVVLNSGPLVLRTDRNLLIGIRYLF